MVQRSRVTCNLGNAVLLECHSHPGYYMLVCASVHLDAGNMRNLAPFHGL